MKPVALIAAISAVLMLSAGCSTMPPMPPLQPVKSLDLQRYVGEWYVIANIPPWIERDAVNSVELYSLDEDGNVPTLFTYRNKSFDAPVKSLKSKGFVVDRQSNAEWGIQFIWPIKAEYLVTWLAEDYSTAIVARNKRDYVWLLARTPQIPEQEYERLRRKIGEMGYDLDQLRKVPQQTLEERGGPGRS